MATTQDYINLIPSANQNQPNFIKTLSLDVSVQVRVQELLQSMIPLFNLDVAVGNQLDILGQWIGVSRVVNIPVTGIYFTWDGAYSVGWDFGIWQGSLTPVDITILPDDAYLTLLRAKIAANHWDGTTTDAYKIWDAIFPTITILIQDNQNMSYDLALVGGIVDSLTLALLTGGYLPLKPEGVLVNTYYVPVNPGPLFGWDLDSTYVQGWDTGSWAREVSP